MAGFTYKESKMKIAGKPVTKAGLTIVVIPRDNEDVVFKFRPLTSKDDFETLYPAPKPPTKVLPGNQSIQDIKNPAYLSQLTQWAANKNAWQFLQSISATEKLEWSKVDLSKPETWVNWTSELEEYFSLQEINLIFNGYLEANSLNEDKLEEARKRFLASQDHQPSS